MVVVSKRKATLEHLTTRCVVLGDKQVGKSASIVRYTTGRFIQEYSKSTNDWLYRHSLGLDPKRNAMITLELLEQKDIQFCSSSKFFTSLKDDNSNKINNNNCKNQQKPPQSYQSLACRVALDQQIDNEYHEKQQLLYKLHWADAYIVIYSVNDISTFNKAIKYLNLIANTINSPSDNNKTQQCSGASSASSNGLIGSISNSSSIGCNSNDPGASGGKLLNKLFPSIQNHHNSNSSSSSTGSISSSCNKIISPLNSHHNLLGNVFCNCNANNGNIKRPILLLANKSDLGRSGRQVSISDGRLLAMRHQSMFAEVSIAESSKLIKSVVSNLIEQIDPICFHIDHMSQQQQQQHQDQILAGNPLYREGIKLKAAKITQWLPNFEIITLNQPNQNSVVTIPIRGSIVKSQAIESDVRSITPLASKTKSVGSKGSLIKPLKACTILSSVEKPGMQKDKSGCVSGQSYRKPISSRYENLKSSFRRASMAIVSSKALAKGSQVAKVLKENDIKLTKVNPTAAGALDTVYKIRSSTNSIPETFECSPIVSKESRSSLEIARNKFEQPTNNCRDASSNWFKNHIKGLSRIDPVSHNSCSISDPKLDHGRATFTSSSSIGGPLTSDRVRKPLLKYKNRRKTVAFEEISGQLSENSKIGIINKPTTIEYLPPIDTSCPNNNNGPSKLLKKGSDESRGGESYSSFQCSSGRSSASLSATDPYYSTLYVLWNNERASSSAGSVSSSNCSNNNLIKVSYDRRSSKSTLSRASTSGGSYEDSGDDDLNPFPKSESKLSTVNKEQQLSSNFLLDSFESEMMPTVATTFHILPQNSIKKRCQLVKSVQSTLTNLSKSSNVSAQAAKRSFCNVLFSKHSSQALPPPSSSPPPLTTSTRAPNGTAIFQVEPIRPIMHLAKTENIRILPIVGYCN